MGYPRVLAGSVHEMNDFQYYNYTHLLFRVSDLVLVVAKIMAFQANHSKIQVKIWGNIGPKSFPPNRS